MASSSSNTGNAGAVVPRSTFQQGGVVDWVGLSNTSFSLTLDILKRISNAGVEALTFYFGQRISNNFRPTIHGLQNIETAVSNLQGLNSFGNILWFGFGAKSFLDSLRTSQQGCVCIALCGALIQHYKENRAAKILAELARLYGAPSEIAPSLKQWRALLRACDGVFAASKYPEILAQITCLIQRLDSVQWPADKVLIQDVAKAIWNLGEVSREEIYSIELSGATDVIWLGTFAAWALGLPTSISNRHGVLIYSNCRPGEERVKIRDKTSAGIRPLALQSRATFEFRTPEQRFFPHNQSCAVELNGRVPWSECLSEAFSGSYQIFCQSPDDLGLFIGSTARMFSELQRRKSELDVFPEKIFSSVTLQCALKGPHTSHGTGFVHTICTYFPEMKIANEEMRKASQLSISDAQRQFSSSLSRLEAACNCEQCRLKTGVIREPNCIKRLALTVIEIAQKLSMVVVAEGLYPTVLGLQNACYEQTTNLPEQKLTSLHTFIWNGVRHPFTNDLLEDVMHLFAHSQNSLDELSVQLSAVSTGGICIYFKQLCEISDVADSPGRIHVLPGRIEHRGRSFSCIEDGHADIEDIEKDLIGMTERIEHISLLVREEMDSLEAEYLFKPAQAHPYTLGPCRLEGASLLRNWRNGCTNEPEHEHGELSAETVGQIDADSLQFSIAIFEGPRDIQCVTRTLLQEYFRDIEFVCITERGRSCLPCYLDIAKRERAKAVLILRHSQHAHWLCDDFESWIKVAKPNFYSDDGRRRRTQW